MNKEQNTSQTTDPAIAVEPVLAPVFVYEFLYNSNCCESAAATISIHKTKKGAEMAMEKPVDILQMLIEASTDKGMVIS